MQGVYGATKNDDGEYACSLCGHTAFAFHMHADGEKEYSYTYRCLKCGNFITITRERTEEDLAWWG